MWPEYLRAVMEIQLSDNNIINFRIEKQVRDLTPLQLVNLKYYFDTEPGSDPQLHRLIKKEINRRELIGEMYEDYACGD